MMAARQNISSGAPWEARFGYCRAVRVGSAVYVAGTAASDEHGHIVGVDDPEAQARYIFQKIERALQQAGASLRDVVRTRMFVTNIAHWEIYAQVHGEFFNTVLPVSTMVEVSKLITPEMLIEIEVDAVITAGESA